MHSLYQTYNNILNDNKYRYYPNQIWNCLPDKILRCDDDAKSFITSFIQAGGKRNDTISELIYRLLQYRAKHTVSTYLLGIVLYTQPYIKNIVDKQLDLLVTRENKTKTDRFLYVWFLICLFHDLGYAYETNSLEISKIRHKKPTIYKRAKKRNMLPDFYTTELVQNYQKYRKHCMKVYDHGIYGGLIMYKKLYDKFKEEKEWIKIFQTTANIIMVHNIYFQNRNKLQTIDYEKHNLHALIYEGNECRRIFFDQHPLLFLFNLVDSIEPLKHMDMTILHNMYIEYHNDLHIRVLDEEANQTMANQISDINSWLSDASRITNDTYRIVL